MPEGGCGKAQRARAMRERRQQDTRTQTAMANFITREWHKAAAWGPPAHMHPATLVKCTEEWHAALNAIAREVTAIRGEARQAIVPAAGLMYLRSEPLAPALPGAGPPELPPPPPLPQPCDADAAAAALPRIPLEEVDNVMRELAGDDAVRRSTERGLAAAAESFDVDQWWDVK